MTFDAPAEADGASRRFVTTRWSLILSSLDVESDHEKAREALAQLCRVYWRPIFAFICRKGYSVPDAQDLTQDFFVMVLKGNLLKHADRNRGRFRSLLLAALQNLLVDAHDKQSAKKRGGDVQFVSWDDWMAEAPSHLSIPASAIDKWPAEKLFDVRWAATVAEQALRQLGEECESHGRRRVFDVLSSSLVAEREDVSYASLARELGVEEPKIKGLLHQMRRRYRQLLRAEVAETIENPEDIDEELRYLCAALAAGKED
jgi:DNA-directed RNA polymerase specialized sigma24 family protein